MDLNDFDTEKRASEGVAMVLRHPVTGAEMMEDKKPVTIRLLGCDAPEYVKAQNKLANKRHQQSVAARKFAVDAETAEKDEIELLVSATVGWDGIKQGEKALPFSKEAARVLYQRPGLAWLRKQAAEFINDREHFLGNS